MTPNSLANPLSDQLQSDLETIALRSYDVVLSKRKPGCGVGHNSAIQLLPNFRSTSGCSTTKEVPNKLKEIKRSDRQ